MKRLPFLLILLPVFVQAQSDPAVTAARQWRVQHERAIVDEFVGLLSIPNVAADRGNIQRNADAIAAMMKRRGIPATLLTVAGANPVVFGEIRTPGATADDRVLRPLRRPAARGDRMEVAAVYADDRAEARRRRALRS